MLKVPGDQQIGVKIVARAIEEPLRWIAKCRRRRLHRRRQGERDGTRDGFNALNGKYENLVNAGVIDPTKVVRSALQNAASIASLLLTTEALVSKLAEERAAPAA